MAAEDRVADLITLTERLAAVLTADADALEAHRPKRVLQNADETSRLANLYRQENARLARNPALLAEAPAPLRAALLKATDAFNAVLARHGRAVAAARTVTEGLAEAIALEVAGQRASPAGYGAAGRAGPANLSAVTLNRRA